MRWLVIGHSGTEGSSAVEGTPWPTLLAGHLSKGLNQPASVDSFRFWPAGAKAVSFALARVNEAAPEGVVLALNAFPSVVSVVSESVENRLGRFPARVYTTTERLIRRGERPGSPRGPLGYVAQRFARRVLGAAPHCEIDDSARVFAELLRAIAQREHLEAVVMAESSFGPRTRRLQPDIDEQVARLHAPARAVAANQRIPWVDAGNFVPNDTEQGWAADNIHLNQFGNEAYARGLAGVILALRLTAGIDPATTWDAARRLG